MQINQLRYIKYVVETGSISKAAERLFISKQGLSLYIRRLEADLGVKLFRRTSSGVELTEDGKVIYEFVRKVIPEYDIMMERLSATAKKNRQPLRVTYCGGFFSCVSFDLLTSFIDANPSYLVEHTSTSDEQIEQSVLDGKFDIAFATSTVKNPELEYHFLFHNYRCLYTHPDHPLAALPRVKFSDLKGVKIAISPPGYYDYPFFLNKCREAMFEPNLFVMQESHLMYQFAKEKLGASLMIRNISAGPESEHDMKELYFENAEECSYDVYLITPRTKKKSEATTAFIKHVVLFCEKEIEKYQKLHAGMNNTLRF